MSKVKQSTAVEQVMDELNEEMSSSVQTPPNLFSSELLNEPTKVSAQEDSLVQIGTALSLEPDSLKEPVSTKKEKKKKKGKKSNQKLEKKGLQPIGGEPASPEELSELENLLSFEPNRNKYQEELTEESDDPQAKPAEEHIFTPLPANQQPQAPLNEKSAKPVTQNKTKLMQGAIGKMAGFYNQTVDPGIAISLKQSENLRVAQERIIALEEEIDRLRKENEELISAGDIFRERIDKITIQNDNLKKSYEENREEFQEEKRTLMNTLNDQSREMDKVAIKNKELEKRLSNNIQQIRVRERELENRLELIKLDTQTLVREKDQYILDLKRQIDKIKIDLETQKNRYTETEQKLKGQKNQTRRATRGLQMALHILKGHDFSLEEKEIEKEE